MPLNQGNRDEYEQLCLKGQGEPRIVVQPDPERDATFNDASEVLSALANARIFNLESEWMVAFLRKIRAGSSVEDAIFAGNCEWDL